MAAEETVGLLAKGSQSERHEMKKNRRRSIALEMEAGQLAVTDTGDGLSDNDLRTYSFATVKWFAKPDSHVHDAAFMFSVSGELFAGMLFMAWIFTVLYHPDALNDNVLKDISGYNNVCVGVDMPPALWVAGTAYTIVSYFQIQYVVYFFERYALEKKTGTTNMPWYEEIFVCGCHWFFLLTSGTFALCFVNHPWDGIRGHTYPFISYMIGRLAVCWAIYIDDARQTVPHIGGKKSSLVCYTYLFVLTVVTIGLPIIWLKMFDAKDEWRSKNPKAPDSDFPYIIDPWIPFLMDYSWLFLVSMQAMFLPERPVVIAGAAKLVNLQTIRDTKKVLVDGSLKRFPIFHHLLSEYEKLPTHKKTNRAKNNWMRMLSAYSTYIQKEEPIHAVEVVDHATVVRMFKLEGAKPREAALSSGWNIITLHCTLTIDDRAKALPYFMQTGLLAKPGIYKGIIRFNATNGGVARMSMRLNVPVGDKDLQILEEAAPSAYPQQYNQIDFMMAEGFKQFHFETLDELTKAMKLKNEPSFFDIVGHFFGGEGYLKAIKDFIHTQTGNWMNNTQGLVGKSYYGALPFLAGKHSAIKWGMESKQAHDLRPEQTLGGERLPGYKNEGKEAEGADLHLAALKEWMTESNTGAKWDFVVQPARHFDEMNIEKGNLQWDEKVSPYLPMGTIHIPKQDVDISTALNDFVSPNHQETTLPYDNTLQFNPWNQLVAHRPLGALNRARMDVYNAAGVKRRAHGSSTDAKVCPFLSLMGGAGTSAERGRDNKIKSTSADVTARGLRKRSPSSRERS